MGKEVQQAWSATTQVLFGKALGRLEDYEEWLKLNVPGMLASKSAISDKIVYIPNFIYYAETQKQAIKLEETDEWGKKHLEKAEAEGLSLSNAAGKLGSLKYFSPEVAMGFNVGLEECSVYFNSSYCFKTSAMVADKYCAYSMWPRNSEYIFGSSYVFSCSFCVKCYHSENLTRCFEVSNSSNCADCYFCHNCENVRDSMFCFNAKNLRHAIGNVELGKEQYAEIKKLLLSDLAKRLENNKGLKHSIYNIGCFKK
ncbi:MAG: hypothetical protein QW568_01815 [Candidatus Anstonellaceae archaeon]